MTGVYQIVRKVSWGLGMISLVAGLVLRLAMVWRDAAWVVSTRGALILAAVLFLCSLATGEMERTGSLQG
jgi:hypothetical protein